MNTPQTRNSLIGQATEKYIQAQFSYVEHVYDEQDWLRQVIFNQTEKYNVLQIIDEINTTFVKEEYSVE